MKSSPIERHRSPSHSRPRQAAGRPSSVHIPALFAAFVMVACVIAASSIVWAQHADGTSAALVAAQREVPPVVRRGMPGPGHAALRALVGTWRVEDSIYMGPGTREHPAVSNDAICRRAWVAGGRYLRDVTEGTVAGALYYREGLLGYSNIDQRYEWVTADGVNANLMIYLGSPGSGPNLPISMSGVFTDAGWLGEETVGKPVGMRTVIRIESKDRHVFDLYFTPPGRKEFLVDRKIYTRITN